MPQKVHVTSRNQFLNEEKKITKLNVARTAAQTCDVVVILIQYIDKNKFFNVSLFRCVLVVELIC